MAWGGPIVMNTKEELNNAFAELKNGTFLKKASVISIKISFQDRGIFKK